MFSKIDVNGKDAHPLYDWLKSEKSGVLGGAIKWNFTKFLVDTEGNVVKRYGSTTTPADIAADIEKLLPVGTNRPLKRLTRFRFRRLQCNWQN